MHRYLTQEELNTTEMGELGRNIRDIIELGTKDNQMLPNCKVNDPLITDDSELLDTVNKKLDSEADFMMYIPVIGTKERFITEAKILGILLERLQEDLEDLVVDDKQLIMFNGMSIQGDEDPKNVHNIIFLFKNSSEDTIVS